MNSIKAIRQIIGTAPIFIPTVGIILYQNGKILLQKRGDDGKWALHGGAMEMGEIKIDENEVVEVEWFEIDKLPDTMGAIDTYILEQLHQYIKRKYS